MRDNMEYLVTACEMQEIDRITINETGIPGLVLMERAAYALSQYIKEKIAGMTGYCLWWRQEITAETELRLQGS